MGAAAEYPLTNSLLLNCFVVQSALDSTPHHTTPQQAEEMATKNAGLQKELNVSDELAKIIGTKKGEKISRPQCTKRLWAYLKEKDLQDPQNKQWSTPNDTMAPIFGTEKIKCFSMSKYLKGHLINPDK